MSLPNVTIIIVAIASVLLAGTTTHAEDGAAVFKEHCAKCHGEAGDSDTATGRTLKIPPLKGAADVAGKPVADIAKAIRENEKHKSVVKKLTDAQIDAAASRSKAIAAGQ